MIPTHHRRRLLAETVASVCAQREVDLEIVIVDDGSPDDTWAWLQTKTDARIVPLRNEQPTGVSAARNRAVSASKGVWIAFLDDDDLWSPDKLQRQLAAVRATGRAWCASGSVSIEGDRRIVAGGPPATAEEIRGLLPVRNCVPAGASNVLVQRDVLQAVGAFDTQLRHMADWDLWIRLAGQGLPAIVPDPDVAYRLHTGNASNDAAAIEYELDLIERRHLEARSGRALDRAFVLRWSAWNALRSGERMTAARSYGKAVGAGDALSIARAVAAIVDPGIVTRTLTADLDEVYVRSAREWLAAAWEDRP